MRLEISDLEELVMYRTASEGSNLTASRFHRISGQLSEINRDSPAFSRLFDEMTRLGRQSELEIYRLGD